MARLLSVTVLAAMLAGLVACSQVIDRDPQGVREDFRQETVRREETTAQERTRSAGKRR